MTKPTLIWDAHSCLPLHPSCDLGVLDRHRRAGVAFVSVNIGMDMNPLGQIMAVIASFRAQIAADERFLQVETMAEVERARDEGKLAIAFDLEGGVALGDRPEMVGLMARLGVKMIHLAYNRSNALAGGCYDDDDAPLSPLGRRMVEAIHENRLLMDVSHTGRRASLDVMNMGLGPVIYSHANPKEVSANARNIDDEQIRACVASGGVVCANGVGRFLRDPGASTASLVEAIDVLTQKIGPDQVGLGLDYSYPNQGLDDDPPGLERAFWWPPAHGYGAGLSGVRIAAPEQIPAVAESLAGLGYDAAAIASIMGGSMARVARRVWGPPA